MSNTRTDLEEVNDLITKLAELKGQYNQLARQYNDCRPNKFREASDQQRQDNHDKGMALLDAMKPIEVQIAALIDQIKSQDKQHGQEIDPKSPGFMCERRYK